ncbi:helix-turn-helix domain-containing protein [Bradyrhizobium diazoefficiens]|uniref:helix-turn-helix domain-containing protein n=1 Tax=Bradyrhizobium diazoefficiens TaxID=1355477 RepID=UPI002012C6D2|nr:helix-turn-helix transcriptional regulator [Bradyrhizobium diazoefficiens]
MDLAQHFGLAVRRHRELMRLSQEELADRAGLDRSYIGRVERGEQNASLSNLQKISQALGSDLDVLFATARELATKSGEQS